MEVESASEGYALVGPEQLNRATLASGYRSIGELYEDLITGIRGLSDQTFINGPEQQFDGNSFFGPLLYPITDQASALSGLKTIIEQGEGNLSVAESHYEVFSKLYSDPDSWKTYRVPTNPKTSAYNVGKDANPYIWKLSRSFDAAYCYLLQNIQRVWQTGDIPTRRLLIRNIHALMNNVLNPLAELLIQQPWGVNHGVAAPCFNFYPMKPGFPTLEPNELHAAIGVELADASTAGTKASVPSEQIAMLDRLQFYVKDNVTPNVVTPNAA